MTSGIELSHITKSYDGETNAVDDVSLVIGPGEFVVLVGPSGCGKSTLMRMIAGLEEVTSGTISIAGNDMTGVQPRDRDVAMIFQNYALYPHMSVQGNLSYGLRVRGVAKAETARRTEDVARLLGLESLLERRPAQLSGGQRQRVAMGRAIVREPMVFLMDEPLSNLDAKLRVGMRAELARLHDRLGVTTVYVTHDQVEAMTLGQRVAVMRDGKVQQIAAPQELYQDPANLFVGAFMGSPAMNLVHARVAQGSVYFGDYSFRLNSRRQPAQDGDVILGIRPHDFQERTHSPGDRPELNVEAIIVESLGSENLVVFAVNSSRVETDATLAAREEADERLFADDGNALFTARVDPTVSIRPGDNATLTVNPDAVHFFDPLSGDSLLPQSSRRGSATPALMGSG